MRVHWHRAGRRVRLRAGCGTPSGDFLRSHSLLEKYMPCDKKDYRNSTVWFFVFPKIRPLTQVKLCLSRGPSIVCEVLPRLGDAGRLIFTSRSLRNRSAVHFVGKSFRSVHCDNFTCDGNCHRILYLFALAGNFATHHDRHNFALVSVSRARRESRV